LGLKIGDCRRGEPHRLARLIDRKGNLASDSASRRLSFLLSGRSVPARILCAARTMACGERARPKPREVSPARKKVCHMSLLARAVAQAHLAQCRRSLCNPIMKSNTNVQNRP
jgi:hypothetical protein